MSLTPRARRPSSKPRYSAAIIESKTVITVYAIACFRVGQLTCFSSPFVSRMYSVSFIFLVLKNAFRAKLLIYNTCFHCIVKQFITIENTLVAFANEGVKIYYLLFPGASAITRNARSTGATSHIPPLITASLKTAK